jgi:hypothetical protein
MGSLMKVHLDSDYRGDLTGEVFYPAGVYEVGEELPTGHADALVAAGRAVVVEEVKVDPPAPAPKPTTRPNPKRKGQL